LCASTHAHQFPVEVKSRGGGEGVEEDQKDSINTNDVSASTQAPVTFDMTTPELSQV
jgi:hypothetical protein